MKTLAARTWAMAILAGFLQVLPFPIAGPVPLWRSALCWISLVPLLFAIVDSGAADLRPVRAALLGYACGFTFYLGNCYWIFATMHRYGGLPQVVAAGILVLFCLYLGLYHALFAGMLGLVLRRFGRSMALLAVPFLWVAVELARARLTGFPWDLLGYAQLDNGLLTRLAPATGTYGISFVIAAVNALWLARLRIPRRRFVQPALAAVGLVVIVLYVAALRTLPSFLRAKAMATATLVQENIEVGTANTGLFETQPAKLRAFSDLSLSPTFIRQSPATMQADGGHPATAVTTLAPADLIVWPESPADFRTNDPAFREAASTLARKASAPLILGSLGVVPDPTIERGGSIFDSAALVLPDGTHAGRYDKIHLVPFGEYIPFKELLFFARKLTAGVGDMDRGTQRSVFRAPSAGEMHAFGVFVCYESIFGDEVRQFVRNGAEVLVNISDDGWYGDSGAPWQHLDMVRMRAIENHRWILRATNTGITSSIDPYGRVVATMPRHIRASVNVPFGFEKDTTFYTRHGDLFAYLCAVLTILAVVPSLRPHVN